MKSKRMVISFTIVAALALLVADGSPVFGKGKPQACENLSVNLVLRDAGDDSVTSDGGSYPAQLNCNNDTNNLFLQTEASRGIVFQLTNPSDGGTFTLVTDGPVSTNLGASIADSGGILGMDVGDVEALTRLQFNFVHDGKRYFLSWSVVDGGGGASVAHPSVDKWVIDNSAQPSTVARLRECPAKGSCKSPVDRFYFAPVGMELLAIQ